MQVTRTFRVFVSSTFEDMKAERNALQERVFPRLSELCEARGARFQAIDLRWGVSEEASLDQQTMPLCLEEITRSRRVSPRPNFIVLLGNRYGWRPLPHEIPAGEFQQIRQRVFEPDDRRLLEAWYRLDENSLEPTWLLQPRTVDRGEVRGDEERWETIEQRLREIFNRAIAALPLSDHQRVKYDASATEQEIIAGALSHPDALRHVYCFFRTIKGLPKDKGAKGYRDLDANDRPDLEAQRRRRFLRWRLREHLPGNVFEYLAHWKGSDIPRRRGDRWRQEVVEGQGITDEHLDELCDDAFRSLEGVIREELEGRKQVEPLAQEISAHEAFAEERVRNFRGRTKTLEDVARYLDRSDARPLVVWGEPGTGKSALLSKAIEQARTAHPDSESVFRFIGWTPRSSSSRDLLEDLTRELGERFEDEEVEIPADIRELAEAFVERLALASADRPLLLFMDALDQLREADPGREAWWIPTELPAHVRLVVSTLPGECLSTLQARLPPESFVMLGAMEVEEAEALLDLWLEEAHRRLNPEQRETVIRRFEGCPRPLYLRLAFEEARRWRSYDGLRSLSPDVEGIIGDLFDRLSAEANHGTVMVERSLGFLAAAKNGLTEDEILAVLSSDEAVMQDFRLRSPKSPEVTQLPVVVWSRLFFDLERYLAARTADGTTLMSFWHPTSFNQAVESRFLAAEPKLDRHRCLARYFLKRPLYLEEEGEPTGKRVLDQRRLSELPFHQAKGSLWNELEETLTDLEFIEAKCLHGRTHELYSDYLLSGRILRELDTPSPGFLDLYESCLRINLGFLSRKPELVFQQYYNQLYWEDQPQGRLAQRFEGIRAIREETGERAWLRRLGPPDYPSGSSIIHVLQDCTHPIEAMAVKSDGTRAAAIGKKRGAIRWGSNRIFELLIWNLSTAKVVTHLPDLFDARLLQDGYAAVTRNQGTFEIWDLSSATTIGTHFGDIPDSPEEIDRLLPVYEERSPGRGIWKTGPSSASEEAGSPIRLTESLSRRERKKLGHVEIARALNARQFLLAAGKRSLGLWNLLRRERIILRTDLPCTFHVQEVNQDETVLALSDYHRNWSGEPHFWVVDLETLMVVPLSGHERPPHSLIFADQGKTLVSASQDGSCRLWDVQRIRFERGFSLEDGLPEKRDLESQKDIIGRGVELLDGELSQEHDFLGESGVAVAIVGSELALFRKESEEPIAALPNAGDEDLTCVISHPKEPEVVFAGGYDTIIRAWNMRSGSLIGKYEGHSGTVRFLGISSDGSTLVSTSADESLAAWNIAKQRLIWRADIHPESLAAFSFLSPEPWFALAGGTKGNELWVVDPLDEQPLAAVPYRNIIQRILCEGRFIFTKDRSGNLAVFELRNTT
jgi:WD40 repeat protein